jgi:hypothetical protein
MKMYVTIYQDIYIPGTCKVRNEIETKRNQSKRNETYRNETKPKLKPNFKTKSSHFMKMDIPYICTKYIWTK